MKAHPTSDTTAMARAGGRTGTVSSRPQPRRRSAVHVLAAALTLSLSPLPVTIRGHEAAAPTQPIQIAKQYEASVPSETRKKPYDPDNPNDWWGKSPSKKSRMGKGIGAPTTGYHPDKTKNFWKHYRLNTKPEKKSRSLDREK